MLVALVTPRREHRDTLDTVGIPADKMCHTNASKATHAALSYCHSDAAAGAESEVLPLGFSPMPLPTRPVDFRSTCQLSVTPEFPLMVKAKIPLPFLMASLTSSGFSDSCSLITSNSCDAGIFSVGAPLQLARLHMPHLYAVQQDSSPRPSRPCRRKAGALAPLIITWWVRYVEGKEALAVAALGVLLSAIHRR